MEASWEDPEAKVLPSVLPAREKWEGEDEDEDVKDNWDDEDEEPKSETTDDSKPKPASSNKKKMLQQKIAEKEEKARAKAALPMTEEERLVDELERRRLQEEADLSLGKEAFGIAEPGSGLDGMSLSSKDDFEEFKKSLVARLKLVERSPHYVPFIESAFREICASMEPDDIKHISSSLNTLFNEKVKAIKATKPGKRGKPKGAGIRVERSALEVDGGGAYDEFEDFM